MHDELRAGPPAVDAWLDQRRRSGIDAVGADWDEQIDKAIRNCLGMLVVLTRGAVGAEEVKREWSRALRFKKPIALLRVESGIDPPYRLEGKQEIDFALDFSRGLAELRTHLVYRDSDPGRKQTLEERRQAAERELGDESNPEKVARIEDEIDLVDQQIRQLEGEVVAATPIPPPSPIDRTRVETEIKVARVNPPPAAAPKHFQDRYVETNRILELVEDAGLRMLTVVGRQGAGKTALACRALEFVAAGNWEDGSSLARIPTAIVYLGPSSARDINLQNLISDMGQILPQDESQLLLERCIGEPDIRRRLLYLTGAFRERSVVVLMDNFETYLDPASGRINDPELAATLTGLLTLPDHRVDVLITTRLPIADLRGIEVGRQEILPLDDGLPSPHAENLLRQLDHDGRLGLRDADQSILNEIRVRTSGYPRALEVFVSVLRADYGTSIEDLLAETTQLVSDRVVEKLVAEAFHSLEPNEQRLMQALAVFSYPVPADAIRYVIDSLGPPFPVEESLRRLVDLFLVRRGRQRYYLHPVDREYALSTIDEDNQWSLNDLQIRAAAYYRAQRKPVETWRDPDDAEAAIAEYELLVEAGQETEALEILKTLEDPFTKWAEDANLARLSHLLLDAGDERVWPIAAIIAASAHQNLGNDETVRDLLERASRADPEVDERLSPMALGFGRANNLRSLTRYQEALDLLNELLDDAREERDLGSEVRALIALADLADARDRVTEAVMLYQSAVLRVVEAVSTPSISNGTDPRSLPAEIVLDPSNWEDLGLIGEDGETQVQIPLFGVTARPSDEIDPENGDSVEELAIPCFIEIADAWLGLANVNRRMGRLAASELSCRLAGSMYEALGAIGSADQCVELLKGIAAEWSGEEFVRLLAKQESDLAHARATGDRVAEHAVGSGVAQSYNDLGRATDSRREWTALRELAVRIYDSQAQQRADIEIARVAWLIDQDEEALRILDRLDRTGADAYAIEILRGEILRITERWDDADAAYRAAVRAAERLDSPSGVIEAELGRAELARAQREYDTAVTITQAQAVAARPLGIGPLTLRVLLAQAAARMAAGDRAGAFDALTEAEDVRADIDSLASIADFQSAVADLYYELENYQEAEGRYAQSVKIYRDLRWPREEFPVHIALVSMYSDWGEHPARQLEAAEAADAIADRLADPFLQRQARTNVAFALSDNGRHQEAVKKMKEVVNQWPNNGELIANLTWVLFQAGDYPGTIAQGTAALNLHASPGGVYPYMGHAHLALGDPTEAEEAYRKYLDHRRGGESLVDVIRTGREMLAQHPGLNRGEELMALLETEKDRIDAATALAQLRFDEEQGSDESDDDETRST